MAKRRGNQEGSLTLRKDGLWAARISHEGKRVAVYGKTKQEATAKLRALQRKQDDNLPLATSQMPLADYLTQWLETIEYQVRPKTLLDYESSIRVHIAPRLGKIRLGKLDSQHIENAWRDMLKAGKSASVVQYAHLRLSKALNDAMKRQLIYRNPCQAVSPPKQTSKELYPPDAQVMHQFLEAAKPTEYYEAIHTAFYTGLRRGELLALRWRDVDLDMATLSVAHSLYRAKGGRSIYQDPKSAKGRRLISLTPSSALTLRSLRERQETDGLLQGYEVNDETPVFRYSNGSPFLPMGFSGAFTRIMRKAGLKGYRLHDARHAHATLMLRQGVHPKIVQERLGHAKVGTTLDIYSHVTAGMQEAAALAFENGLMESRRIEASVA
jgi:integrase